MSRFIIAIYVVLTSLGLILLKLGSGSGAPITFVDGKLGLNLNIATIAGLASYGLSFILYVYLISKYDLGYIIPILAAFVYILVFAASAVVFNETFTAAKVIGITFIVGGLVLLNLR